MVAETSLRDRRSRLLAQPGLQGQEFCRRYAAEADAWLSGLAERAAGDSTRHLALVAVGGYGRASLCPYSDLDVVLVHNGHRDIGKVADAIWYPVWDEGVHLDHSVRRPSEVLSAAAEDVRVALGLLDGRLVWGEPRVAEPLLDKARAAWRDRLGTRYLPLLEQQMAERRATAGDVAFLLEPDLKESHGGLRDVSVLRAISAYAPLLAEYADLASLESATALLTDIRVELHRLAQREHDKLLLQDQDQVAAALGFTDADALMLAVSTAGRQIAWVSDDVWRRRRLWDPTPPPKRRFRRATPDRGTGPAPAQLGPDMVEIDGEIALTSLAPVSDDASLPLRLAATAAELDRPIAKGSLHRLADRMPPPGDPWADETRAALVALLGLGRPAIDKIESLDQHGLLVRLIPEWAAVRNKPQRNAYHTFTVDRHLLEAAALAAELTDTVERPDLLLVGTLLHDIGKGFPGDHTTVGMEVVERIGTRMGFAPADVAVLVDLVRNHLLLPDTATRRDLDDPTTIARVAQAAGEPADAAPAGRLDRGGQQGHRPLRLGRLEGRPRRGPRRAHRPHAPGGDRAGRAGPHRDGQPRAHGGGARDGAPVGLAPAAPRDRGRAGPARPLLLRRRRARAQRHGRAGRQRQRRGRRGRRGVHRRGGPRDLARHGQAARGPGGRALGPHGPRRAPLRA